MKKLNESATRAINQTQFIRMNNSDPTNTISAYKALISPTNNATSEFTEGLGCYLSYWLDQLPNKAIKTKFTDEPSIKGIMACNQEQENGNSSVSSYFDTLIKNLN
ncbi:hypothetical protein [Methylovulum psychrotolerans]|nr:hypothetical protein [Methylovulum psychrotolerans]